MWKSEYYADAFQIRRIPIQYKNLKRIGSDIVEKKPWNTLLKCLVSAFEEKCGLRADAGRSNRLGLWCQLAIEQTYGLRLVKNLGRVDCFACFPASVYSWKQKMISLNIKIADMWIGSEYSFLIIAWSMRD